MKKLAFLMLFLLILLTSISFAAPLSATTHVYFNGKRITSIDSNSTRLYYHQDYLGSTRIITDQNGVLVSRIDYEPFGRELVDTTKTKYTFTGKEQDATGLQYFGARYYDSGIGRFTQVDPNYNPSESPYEYARNNPLKYVDPNGKDAADSVAYPTEAPDLASDAAIYIENNFARIYRAAQDMLGIHTGRLPTISLVPDTPGEQYSDEASYFEELNKVNIYKIPYFMKGPDMTLDIKRLEGYMIHESVHALIMPRENKLIYRMRWIGALATWKENQHLISRSFVNEGVARHYENKFLNKRLTIEEMAEIENEKYAITSGSYYITRDWMGIASLSANTYAYNLGAYLLGPIVDKYGGAGAIYMGNHPPTEGEYKDMRLYQQRMMNELGSARR